MSPPLLDEKEKSKDGLTRLAGVFTEHRILWWPRALGFYRSQRRLSRCSVVRGCIMFSLPVFDSTVAQHSESHRLWLSQCSNWQLFLNILKGSCQTEVQKYKLGIHSQAKGPFSAGFPSTAVSQNGNCKWSVVVMCLYLSMSVPTTHNPAFAPSDEAVVGCRMPVTLSAGEAVIEKGWWMDRQLKAIERGRPKITEKVEAPGSTSGYIDMSTAQRKNDVCRLIFFF